MTNPLFFLSLAATLGAPPVVSTMEHTAARPTSRWTYKCDAAPALRCTFTSTSLGSPIRYVWDWADGRTETSPIATNTWSTPGSYRVRLTVYRWHELQHATRRGAEARAAVGES